MDVEIYNENLEKDYKKRKFENEQKLAYKVAAYFGQEELVVGEKDEKLHRPNKISSARLRKSIRNSVRRTESRRNIYKESQVEKSESEKENSYSDSASDSDSLGQGTSFTQKPKTNLKNSKKFTSKHSIYSEVETEAESDNEFRFSSSEPKKSVPAATPTRSTSIKRGGSFKEWPGMGKKIRSKKSKTQNQRRPPPKTSSKRERKTRKTRKS